MKTRSYHYICNQEDFSVWEQFRSGDQGAMGKIFRIYYQALFKYGMTLVKDEEMVEDSIQNLFERLWFSRERLSSVMAIKPYLFKALRFHIIDQIKGAKQQLQVTNYYCENFTVTRSYEDMLIAEQSREEQQKKLLDSLKLLSKRQREAIYLKTFEELEYDKISEVMLLNPQSIRNLIHQAVKTLKGNRSQLLVI